MENNNIRSESPLLEVKDLHVSFKIMAGKVEAVNGVSFTLEKGKILGIVGESGSGKSVSSYSILQILDSNGKIDKGSIKFEGIEMVGMAEEDLREIRGNRIAMIFQDPMTALNPVYTIGNQLEEAIRTHEKEVTKEEAHKRCVDMLKEVGFNEPEKRLKQYPFEFSGGMLQRAVIAMALVCKPDLLIADEPTTALDVTIQAQILELLKSLQEKFGMAIIIITHDLGVVAQICDEVDVMYAGRIVEKGTADEIFYTPKHEYTKGLINSVPTLEDNRELIPIKGNPVNLLNLPKGCSFSPRCDKCMKICIEDYPPQLAVSQDHFVSCWNAVKEMQDKGEIDVTLPPEAPDVKTAIKLEKTEEAVKEPVKEEPKDEEETEELIEKEDKAEPEETKPEAPAEEAKPEEKAEPKEAKPATAKKAKAIKKAEGAKKAPKKKITIKDYLNKKGGD